MQDGALDEYRVMLERRRDLALRALEDAPDFNAVLEARGAKKILDALLADLTLTEREESAYARFRQQGT